MKIQRRSHIHAAHAEAYSPPQPSMRAMRGASALPCGGCLLQLQIAMRMLLLRGRIRCSVRATARRWAFCQHM